METILSLKAISKDYREFKLDSISLEVPRGYILGLIGPNGAGKTTTIQIVMNLVRPSGGELSVFGMGYPKEEKAIKNRIGYVGEVQYFYEDRSVDWTGNFVSHFYENWDKNLFASLLNDFQISTSKKIRELSKGMRVKLSLALALSHQPDLILLDEPTSGLDPIVRREVLDLLRKLISEDDRKSVVISSHITDDIERIADIVAYMVNGKIVLSSGKDDLLANWKRIHYRKGSLDGDITGAMLLVEENAFGCSGITDAFLGIKGEMAGLVEQGDVKIENVGLDDILICYAKGGRS